MIARRAGTDVIVGYEPDEAKQLIDLFTGVSALIADPDAAEGVDPARARLLPDGHRDDPQAAEQFREMTEVSLIAGKRAALATCVGELAGRQSTDARPESIDVRLDPAGLQRWLQAINDVRLALGTRLESIGADLVSGSAPRGLVRDDMVAGAQGMWLVYRWLTEVQDELVEIAMSGVE